MASGGPRLALLTPLRQRTFARFWAAGLVANFGWLIQGTAAGWLMTVLSGRPDMVALVQVAVQAPILVLSLVAGAVADLWDRRLVLLASQLWMLGCSLLLAALTAAGVVGPALLLAFTFALGLGAALQGPAFQASLRDLVPGQDLAAAVTLNGVSFNFARAAAPAIGGFLILGAGAEAAFLVNAFCYLGMVAVLLTWRRPVLADDLPREPVGRAIVTGLRYSLETAEIRAVLLRSAAFSVTAGAPLALMPLIARDLLHGGPLTFGVLLGAFGGGAMAAAFLVPRLRARLGVDRLVRLAALVFAGMLAVLALVPSQLLVLPALAAGGGAWLASFVSFNVAIQTSSAFWVQARVFALYQTVMFGSMGLGSWGWGSLATAIGLSHALLAAAAAMAATAALAAPFRLAAGPVRDLRPLPLQPETAPRLAFDPSEGPVLVLVEYRVANTSVAAFRQAIGEVGHLRRRNGAERWEVFEDVAAPERWMEAFTVGSWLDYRRQARRATAADEALLAEALAHHQGPDPPVLRQLVARHPGVAPGRLPTGYQG